MTATSDTFPREAPAAAAPMAKTRPFFWSVQRELWENVAIYRAPLIAAAVVLFGVVLGHITSHRVETNLVFSSHHSAHLTAIPPIIPYAFAVVPILITACIVGVFYCLAALNAERRDRSVLFWKSLPVSDLTTVLSKAVVPALILPAVTFVVLIGTELLMLAMDVAAVALKGGSIPDFMSMLPLGQLWLDLAYLFVIMGAWWAPIWSWLLLASAWSKRMSFLWGVAPPLAICVIERMAFGTDYAWKLLGYRLGGGLGDAFTGPAEHRFELPWPDPMAYLANPGLWIGLVVAAGFLAGAVWLRRRQEPV